jgi:hypothetical protein
MDGIPRTLPNDSEDVVWALETAESLWKRGERVDAVVWLRRAAQAAGETDDAKRAASLANSAAELGDWIASHAVGADGGPSPNEASRDSVDALLAAPPREGSDVFILEGNDVGEVGDVEVVSAQDFEAGFERPQTNSDHEVMTVSINAPDVELVDDDGAPESEEFPEEEPTPVVRGMKSPVPAGAPPTAAQAHVGMLDPWSQRESSSPRAPQAPQEFEEEEIVTSAKSSRATPEPPPKGADAPPLPPAPKAPTFPVPPTRSKPSAPSAAPARAASAPTEDAETTTYRQINPRSGRAPAPPAPLAPPPARARVPPPAPSSGRLPSPAPPPAQRAPAKAPPPAPRPAAPMTRVPKEERAPALDLLELVDSVVAPPPSIVPAAPKPSAAPTPKPPAVSIPASARPTAPPPSTVSAGPSVSPSTPPTRPHAGATLLDLAAVEALGDLPDDAREAFALAATMHAIALEEEVSHFALALVVDGEIDVASTIVEAPAMRLERNAVLRSRGTLVPGVPLRLLGASTKSLVASWDDAAVAEAFRSCPWVEDDLRAVADRVQARVGLTMGPLGERLDLAMREHLTSKLTLKALGPGEVLVAQGKPVGVIIVGIGEIVTQKKTGERTGAMRPGDFVFPSQTLAHGNAPDTAAAGEGGAVVFLGDRATAQDLLMTFPPLLEVLAML